MKIRKAKQSDFNEIAKIFTKEPAKKPYNEDTKFASALKEVKAFSKDELYIAEENKKVIGFIAANITSGSSKEKAYIKELWLDSEYQGKGIGKKLVKFIEEFYKRKGVKTIRLVAHRQSKAFGFYKKNKFKEYDKLVFMERKLK